MSPHLSAGTEKLLLSSDDQKGLKVSTLKMYKAKVLALRNNLVPARWLSR